MCDHTPALQAHSLWLGCTVIDPLSIRGGSGMGETPGMRHKCSPAGDVRAEQPRAPTGSGSGADKPEIATPNIRGLC